MIVILLQRDQDLIDLILKFVDEAYQDRIIGTCNPEEALQLVKEWQTHAVLVTCHYVHEEMWNALCLAEKAKSISPQTPVYTYSVDHISETRGLISAQIVKLSGAQIHSYHFHQVANILSELSDGIGTDQIKEYFPTLVM